ncbi:MAG: hypothetical protein JKY95_08000 [Planctomycetaceae bacterium]|nr:hypothetical protein [Planctomycetaceae bacterium]
MNFPFYFPFLLTFYALIFLFLFWWARKLHRILSAQNSTVKTPTHITVIISVAGILISICLFLPLCNLIMDLSKMPPAVHQNMPQPPPPLIPPKHHPADDIKKDIPLPKQIKASDVG